ncbi:MAG: hypothetical protein JWM74_3193 [Myxococcaceae bacterium]|nr:hypothetical protein [Myxococcaceae bacterium]
MARTRTTSEPYLAPEPDFRYVGLAPGPAPQSNAEFFGSVLAAGTGVGAGLLHVLGARAALMGGLLASVGTAFSLRRGRGPSVRRWGAKTVKMAIVPWGILLDDEAHPRVLHWAGITRVHVEMTYGRDGATDSTLWSVIVVETEHERFVARTAGAVPLDRLLAHLEAYTREAAHVVALDLDGNNAAEGPVEPECEPLLHAVRAFVDSAPGSTRLSLPPSGYRHTSSHAASGMTIDELRKVLVDRRERTIDPRPFAAMVAAELGARELVHELISLVQSPHPVTAAVAKVAAHRLGVATSRVGTLDEVAPFLLQPDVDVLHAWGAKTA